MILIVDDSATNQVLLEAILQEEGFETVTAFCAKEAFEIIEKRSPRLILLDLLMPEVSGLEFLKRYKEFPDSSDVPVIVVSAVDSVENIEMSKQYGAIDYITKPIDIKQFVSRVKEVLS